MKQLVGGVVVGMALLAQTGCARRDGEGGNRAQASLSARPEPVPRPSTSGPSPLSRLPKPTAEQAAEAPISFTPLMTSFSPGAKLTCPAGASSNVHLDEGHGASVWCAKPAQGDRHYDPARRSGPLLAFHKNGRLALQITYQDGHAEGPSARFDEDGNMTSFYTYKNGVENGLAASWSSIDKKRRSESTYANGKLNGSQKLWLDGELVAIIEHRDGAIVSEQKFDHRLKVMTEEERREQKKKLDEILAKQRRLLEELEQNPASSKNRAP